MLSCLSVPAAVTKSKLKSTHYSTQPSTANWAICGFLECVVLAYQVRDEGDLAEEGVENDGVGVWVHLALLDGVRVVVGVADVRLRLRQHAPTYEERVSMCMLVELESHGSDPGTSYLGMLFCGIGD